MMAALIPLRGGSKSIPRKNIKSFAGKPLCAWVLEAAAGAASVDHVYVSTDSPEIKNVVESLGLGVTVLDRPAELAGDDSSTEDVMMHFAQNVAFDVLCTVQATSPLLSAQDIDAAMATFEQGGFDSLLTAVREKRFYWGDDFQPINYDPLNRPRRQDFAGTLMENGAFYLTRRDTLLETGCRLGGRIGIYEMSEETAVEIDEPRDWAAAEALILKRVRN